MAWTGRGHKVPLAHCDGWSGLYRNIPASIVGENRLELPAGRTCGVLARDRVAGFGFEIQRPSEGLACRVCVVAGIAKCP